MQFQFTSHEEKEQVWGTNCPSCFHEFRNFTHKLTARYRNNKNIAFVYICIDRYPFAELRWKEKINQFRPEGIHILVRREQEEIRLAHDITGNAVDGKYFPYQPYYFIFDQGGKNITPQSADPEKGELRPGDTELLFRKLDELVIR